MSPPKEPLYYLANESTKPSITSEYPPPRVPSSYRARPVRTSVGAHQNVVEVGGAVGAAAAADDVDGASGVDHGCVPFSPSPRRAGRTTRPSHTCGQDHDRPMPKRNRPPRTANICEEHKHTKAHTPAHTNKHIQKFAHAQARAHVNAKSYKRLHAHGPHVCDKNDAHAQCCKSLRGLFTNATISALTCKSS